MHPILGLVIFWLIFDIPYLIFRFLELLAPAKTKQLTSYPLVTILVPAYNEEKTITRTLNASGSPDSRTCSRYDIDLIFSPTHF